MICFQRIQGTYETVPDWSHHQVTPLPTKQWICWIYGEIVQEAHGMFHTWWKTLELQIPCMQMHTHLRNSPITSGNSNNYLGYLVGTNSVPPLPEKVATIQALEPPKNIEELWQFLALVGFYRKFIPFFVDPLLASIPCYEKEQCSSWLSSAIMHLTY